MSSGSGREIDLLAQATLPRRVIEEAADGQILQSHADGIEEGDLFGVLTPGDRTGDHLAELAGHVLCGLLPESLSKPGT